MSIFENYEYWAKLSHFGGIRAEIAFTMNGYDRLLFCDKTMKKDGTTNIMFLSFSIKGYFSYQVQLAFTPSLYYITDKPLYKRLKLIGNTTIEDAEAAMVSFELTRERNESIS